MSKFANPGELRTPVVFKRTVKTVNENGFPVMEEKALFGGAPVMSKWVNAHGSEVWEHQTLDVRERATLTLRYSPALCDNTLLVYRAGDARPFEVVAYDNVEQRGVWLELTVQRKEAAR